MDKRWFLVLLPAWLIGAGSGVKKPSTPAECKAAMGEFADDLPDIARPHVYGGTVSHDRLTVKNRLSETSRILTDTLCRRVLRTAPADSMRVELVLRLAISMRVAIEEDD
jgi:hypothetical protein